MNNPSFTQNTFSLSSMAPLFFFFLLLFKTSFSLSSNPDELPLSLLLPLTKHTPTGHYLAHIHHSKLVLDLAGPLLWLNCGPNKPSPVNCRSIQCSSVKAHSCGPTTAASREPPCTLPVENPITGATTTGELVQDDLALLPQSEISAVDFLFSCAPSILLTGLPTGAKGVLGLGKTRVGALSQISHSFGYYQKFSLCLSSTNGMIFSGENEIEGNEISKSLIYTPLLDGDDYVINLKGIKIQNKKLSLGFRNEFLPFMKISTVSPFTKLESGVYKVLLRAFTMGAESLNMTRVESIAPFGACYDDKSLAEVPVIDLVLQSEMVKWRIYGHNSMVKVKEGVMCLGFLDGGLNLGASVVLGGHQLEDNLLEFDLGSSMLGFSSSLVKTRETSCSQLTLSSTVQRDVQSL